MFRSPRAAKAVTPAVGPEFFFHLAIGKLGYAPTIDPVGSPEGGVRIV